MTPEVLTLEHQPTSRGHELAIRGGGPCADLPSSEPSCGTSLQACLSEWTASVESVYGEDPPMFYAERGFRMRAAASSST